MSRPVAFALGITLGSLAMPTGLLIGQWVFDRNVLDPQRRKPIPTHTPE